MDGGVVWVTGERVRQFVSFTGALPNFTVKLGDQQSSLVFDSINICKLRECLRVSLDCEMEVLKKETVPLDDPQFRHNANSACIGL